MQLFRKFTSSTINSFIGSVGKGMKANRLSSISVLVLPFYLVFYSLAFILCLCLRPAPHSDLNIKPTRPDPEGESSPPKTDKTQRMESPAKKDTDRRLTTPTKSDVIPRSPGSSASPAPRSKRKEGKRKQKCHLLSTHATCTESRCLKVKTYNEA